MFWIHIFQSFGFPAKYFTFNLPDKLHNFSGLLTQKSSIYELNFFIQTAQMFPKHQSTKSFHKNLVIYNYN